MGIQINIAEAKAKLSELVARAEAGEDVVLARNGKPVLRLQTLEPKATGRQHAFLGALSHLGPIPDGDAANTFDEPDQDNPDPSGVDDIRPPAGKKHAFMGAFAHLGPLSEEEATMFLGPDPEFERLAASEDEDEFYR